MMDNNLAILIDPADDVATAFAPLKAGASVTLRSGETRHDVVLLADIPAGHKFAVVNVAAGAPIRKYAASIGRATRAVRAGEHVHLHNLESLRGRGDRT